MMPRTADPPQTAPRSARWRIPRAVIWAVFYTFVPNRDGNLNVPYLVENGGKVVLNWNWLDNDWDANCPALRFANLFVSPLSREL